MNVKYYPARLAGQFKNQESALMSVGFARNRARLIIDNASVNGSDVVVADLGGGGRELLVVLALGIVVMANAVSVRYSARWDLTENKRHSLASQTVKVLQGLKTPVEVIAFFRSDHYASLARERPEPNRVARCRAELPSLS